MLRGGGAAARRAAAAVRPRRCVHQQQPGDDDALTQRFQISGRTQGLPDFVEEWGRGPFKKVGAAGAALAASAAYGCATGALSATAAVPVVGVVAMYWLLGLRDMNSSHALKRNFPVLANVRYLLESIRPEIRQYFVEGDTEANPYDRLHRSAVYQRAKGATDTMPFGTRRDVYARNYEWAKHSMYPRPAAEGDRARVLIGGPQCTQKYSASLLNISAMSYGALSDNAILALNEGAKIGGFYHNTGEGGISRFHLEPGGDIVWNIGSGYFGCRDAKTGGFCPEKFKERSALPNVKMIELKLSQGAKPGQGGLLPQSKITPFIAEARGIGMDADCKSPMRHSAFSGPRELIEFVARLREMSGGKPVGIKLCVGHPEEFMALVHAMVELKSAPDFITVDGSEGGTGAAPPEFSNSVGSPLIDGLVTVDRALSGAGVRQDVRLIASGKVLTGFSIVRNLALGADLCNAARAMMFALGCIQALKCNTNKCPTGITTSDPELMSGLVVPYKSQRVALYHKKTVGVALDIIGAMGLEGPDQVRGHHVMRRVNPTNAVSYAGVYPAVPEGCLIEGTCPSPTLQQAWDESRRLLDEPINCMDQFYDLPLGSDVSSKMRAHLRAGVATNA